MAEAPGIDLGLKDKKVIVSAGTGGIGYSIARGFAKAGSHVIITGRAAPKLQEAVNSIQKETGNKHVEGIAADAGTPEGCKAIIDKYPKVDILVNNLGIFPTTPFTEIKDEEWLNIFDVNVLSGVRLSRFYLPVMKAQNWGRIIFISSESAINIPEEMIHYGITKSCQVALASGLAKLTKGTGVTVNTVLPGPTKTEGVDVWLKSVASKEGLSLEAAEKKLFQESGRSSSLLGRFLSSDEIAWPVLFLASPLASATNGSCMRAEGGILRNV